MRVGILEKLPILHTGRFGHFRLSSSFARMQISQVMSLPVGKIHAEGDGACCNISNIWT